MALVLAVSVFLSSTHRALAQDKPEATKDDEKELPQPETIDLVSEDGLQIKATYYPGTKGEESIPVILLHGFKGSRMDFPEEQGLGHFLQEKLGCAVIVPDLRGHGDSTLIKISAKRQEDLKNKKLQPAQLEKMATQDLLVLRNYLWKKNNEKKLNIDKLTVIGVDEGASLALRYVAYDAGGYEDGQARVGPLKLGRFVKAVVLISPLTNVPALKIALLMRNLPEVRHDLPLMIALGNKSKDRVAEAERLNSLFLKLRPPADDNKPESHTIWYFSKIETPLQGAKLLAEPSLKVPEKIASFMSTWLVKNFDAKDWSWAERKRPYE